MLKTILDYALDYCDRGFSVIPIRPGPEKRPYIAWTEFQKRRATPEEIESWFAKWPQANIGIVTGSISGIFVVDGDGEIGSRWIASKLPVTAVYAKTGREGGIHAYYRIPVGAIIKNKVGWRPKVDIRGEGGYVVAPPSVHHNGRTYELIFRGGLSWSDLVEGDPDGKFIIGNLSMYDFSNITECTGEKVREGSRNDAITKFIGSIIASGITPNEAYQKAVSWNYENNVPPLGEKEVKGTFNSILKTHQKKAGPDIEVMQPVDDEAERFEAFIAGPKTDCYPPEILQPGGIMQEIMTCIERTSAASLPLFSLGAAIAIVGNVCGQRIMTEMGTRTNMYIVCLGYSGSGKNASNKFIGRVLNRTKAACTVGPTELASSAALLKWLSIDGRQISILSMDEIGLILQGLKNPSSSLAEFPKTLMKLFSSAEVGEDKKAYADEKNNINIPWSHTTVFGSSVPDEFWSSLSEGSTTNGFLARFLVLESTEDAPFPQPPVDHAIPKTLIDKLSALYQIKTLYNPDVETMGDIAKATPGQVAPMPHRIYQTDEARAEFYPFAKYYHDLKNFYKAESCKSSVYGRVAEHAGKLALIHAASLHGPAIINNKIGVDSVRWGIAVAIASCDRILASVQDNVAMNQHHAIEQKIVRLIKRRATIEKPGLPSRDIKNLVYLPDKNGNEIILSMVKKGMLFQKEIKNKRGKPSIIFCIPAK